jgi:hypothetical protein
VSAGRHPAGAALGAHTTDHDIVEVTVIVRCSCGATGIGSTESGALDDLEAACAERHR